MDQILDIQLHVNNGFLVAIETFNPVAEDRRDRYQPVEFITYNECTREIAPTPTDDGNSIFELDKDGKYYYYKMLIPYINRFVADVRRTILTVGEIFYHEGKIMQIQSDPASSSKSDILAASREITGLQAYDAVTKNITDALEANESYFFPKKEILNICNIRKCLLYLQRKLLLESCKNHCFSNKELRQQRDMIFNAVYVLDFLKETGNFEEAQRIIDNLSSCGLICDGKSITFSDCGCGHTV